MTESIPTTWSDERDVPFFGITATLAADGFADDTALLTAGVATDSDLAAQIEKVLEDLIVAESWESTALRSIAHSKPRNHDLVPVPVTAPRRAA